MEALRERYPDHYPEDGIELGRILHELGNELGADGVFNFLLADGQHLFARCGDNLSTIERRFPFGEATLVDADVKVNFAEGVGDDPSARMAVIATEPLTVDEPWDKAVPGALRVFRHGELLKEFPGNAEAIAAQ